MDVISRSKEELKNNKSSLIMRHKKEIILSGLSQIVLIIQLVVQNKILVTFFSKGDFGRWSLLLSIYVLISMLPFTAIDQAIAKFTYKKVNSEEKFYFVNGVYVVYLILFIGYIFFLGGLSVTWLKNSVIGLFFIKFIFYTITEVLKNSLLVMDNASRNRKRVLFLRLFDLVFRTTLLLLLAKLNVFIIQNILIVFIFGNLLSIISSYKKFDRIIPYIKINKIKNIYKEIINFSYPLMIWAIFGWLQNMVNRWYLNYYLDSKTVGTYTILVSLSFFLPNAFNGVVNNFFMPYVFSKNTKTSISLYKKYLLIISMILGLYSFLMIFASEYLVIILADKKYLNIAPMIPLLTLSTSIYIIAMLSTFEIYRSGDTKILLLPTILSGLIPTVVGFFAVKIYGFNGAIFNYVLCQLFYAVMVLNISYRHIRRQK